MEVVGEGMINIDGNRKKNKKEGKVKDNGQKWGIMEDEIIMSTDIEVGGNSEEKKKKKEWITRALLAKKTMKSKLVLLVKKTN